MDQINPKTIKYCDVCGVLLEKTTCGRKYCDGCRAEAYRQRSLKFYRINKAKKAAKVPNVSLIQMAAEAKSYGMTYGQYSVALQNGTLPERITKT